VCLEDLLYKLTILLPTFPVKTISYLHCRTIQTAFRSTTFTRRSMRDGAAQGGLISPVIFCLYVNDMPTPSCHIVLALCADNTALRATSRSPLHLVRYLLTYLSRLEHWLRECTAINVSKRTAVFLLKLRDATEDAGQSSFSDSQYNGSKKTRTLSST
jgi:hypothetical protein